MSDRSCRRCTRAVRVAKMLQAQHEFVYELRGQLSTKLMFLQPICWPIHSWLHVLALRMMTSQPWPCTRADDI